jgi:hypothetical protein
VVVKGSAEVRKTHCTTKLNIRKYVSKQIKVMKKHINEISLAVPMVTIFFLWDAKLPSLKKMIIYLPSETASHLGRKYSFWYIVFIVHTANRSMSSTPVVKEPRYSLPVYKCLS